MQTVDVALIPAERVQGYLRDSQHCRAPNCYIKQSELHALGRKLLMCSGCRGISYCVSTIIFVRHAATDIGYYQSKECQRRGWSIHKPECKRISDGNKRVADNPELKGLYENLAKWETSNSCSIGSALVAGLDLLRHPTNRYKLGLSIDLRYTPGATLRGQRFVIEAIQQVPLDPYIRTCPDMGVQRESAEKEAISYGDYGAGIVMFNIEMEPKYHDLGGHWYPVRLARITLDFGVVEEGWQDAFRKAVAEGRIFNLIRNMVEAIEQMADVDGEVGKRYRVAKEQLASLIDRRGVAEGNAQSS